MSKRVVLSDVEKVDLPEIPVIEEVRQIRFTKDMELVTEVADSDLFMIQRAANVDEHPKIITLENIIKCMAGDMEEGGYKFITGDTLFKIVGDMEALVTWDNSNLVNALNETYNQVLQTNNNLQDEIDRSTTTDIDHDTRINNNRQDIISNTDLINAETDRAQAEENKIRQEIADYKAEQAIRDENQDKALQAETDRAEEQEAAIRQEMADKFEEQAAKDLAQDNALKKEREDRQTEDTLIRKEIADNKTEQSAKDLEQDNALKKEIQNRKDADDLIQAGIDQDKVAQATKDKAQDDALAAEVTRAKGEETAIRSEMAEEKRLQGIKDAAQDKALADETTRAKAKETEIQANLDAEIARATQEEQDIYANLGDEITRAVTREDEIEQKFTEWDNNQDNRLELLESLTHEQNTDTGTDKTSFQLDMKKSGPRVKVESGGLSARNAADSAYVNFRANDVTVDGDLIVKGQQSIIKSQTVEVADNTLLLNKGEVGPGVTKGFAGIEIDRGTEENFFFGFNESDDMFKIGKEGSMMDVALRDTVADMNDGMFVSWNATRKVLETTNTLPATHKITFKGNSTSIDYAIRNHADQFILENPAVSTQNVSLRFVNNRATFDTGTTHFHFLKAVFVPGYIASANSKLGIGIGNNTTEIVVIDASKITSTKPIHATTFYRSSDSSEVLYKADIVNDVTTGGATNVLSAEQGKLLAQGITQVEGSYLPLSGGTMTGTIRTNSAIILSPSSVSRLNGINVNDEGLDIDRSLLAYAKDYSKGPATIVATMKDLTLIRSNNSDLLHGKANAEGTAITSYKIWDASNLTKPVNYNDGGTAGNVINIYQRKLGVNGVYWTFLGLTNEATTGVYAPTAAGIAGQILQSTGGVPAWVNASSILGEYLPLSGGVITSSTATPLTINGTGSASDIGIAVKRANVNKAYFGHNSNLGAFMYSYTRDKYLYISDTADEVIFGKSGSSKRLAFIDDIPSVSGYLTKSVADATYLPIGGKGFLSIDSNGKPIMSNNQGYSAKQANGTVKEILWIGSNDNLNIGYSITHDAKIVTAGTLVTYGGLNYLYNRYSSPTFLSCVNINHNTSSTGGWARSFNIINQEEVTQVTYGGYGSSGTPNYAYIGVGTGVSYNSVNNLRVYVDKVTFNSKQLATTDQIPSLSGYATQEWANTQFINALAGENYVNITLPSAAKSSAGAKKYLEWWDSTPGWYNFKLGRVEAQGVLMSTNNGNTVTIGSQNDKYCHIQNSANIPFHFNNNVFVKGNLYMGASYDKLVATQEWVTSQGFLKTDKDTHYTTMFNVGVATTKADAVATNPYFKLFDDSTLRKQIRINGAGATTVTSDASGNITITSTDTNTVYSLPNATASVLGGVKVGSNITVSSGTISLTKANVTAALGYTPPTTNTTYAQATSSALGLVKIGYAESGKNYPVELNSSGQMYVNVPWSDTNTTYSIATASTAGLVKPISVITKPTLQGATTTSGRYYSVQMSSDGNMFVNVPWSDTNTTYAQATASTLGLVKIGATGLSSKNYAVQLNSSGQMYVAVPWTDTNTTYSLASTSANGLLRQLNGSTSSFLRGDGTWATPPNTTYSVATTSANGLMSSADKTKVNNAVISTSTTKVLKIEVVDEIPTTQTTGTLYLKLE